MFDIEVYKAAELNDNQYHHSRSKADSVNFYHKPGPQKFQSSDKFLEFFDLPDSNTNYDSPTLFGNLSKSFLQFNQSQASTRKTGAN